LQICTIPTVPDSEVDEKRLVYVSIADMRARAGSKSSAACASLPVIVPESRVSTSAAAAVSVGSAGFCLAHVPATLEAAPFALDAELDVVERVLPVVVPGSQVLVSSKEAVSGRSAGFCLAQVPTALEAAPSASGAEMDVVERIERSVGGPDALSRASPASPADLCAVREIDEATNEYEWRDGFSQATGLSGVAGVRSELLVFDRNRFLAAAHVPDEEYRLSATRSPSESQSGAARPVKKAKYRRARRRRRRAGS
jgi:hypothetical protein